MKNKSRYLFRGKRVDNGEWVKGNLISTFPRMQIYNPDCRVEVIPETVGHSTGLKDKEGKLIFEGDIVYCDITCYPVTKPHKGTWVWTGSGFTCMGTYGCGHGSVYKITGTIHDREK